MIRIILLLIAILAVSYFVWKKVGKTLAEYLANDVSDDIKSINEIEDINSKERIKNSLEEKIDELKAAAEALKNSTEELKVGKMLAEINKQLKEKEMELNNLDTQVWLEKK